MDPDVIWEDLLAALETCEWEFVEELSRELGFWLYRNGFPPKTLGAKSLGDKWHRELAQFVCKAALAQAKRELKTENKKGGR